MSERKEFVCIGCPMGCPLQLTHEGRTIVTVEGNQCGRGSKYAKQEFTDPRRSLSTTVLVRGGLWARLPVKVSKPVPKERVREVAALIHGLRVEAPVSMGEVLLRNVLGEPGIDVVATRSMPSVG
jgi:CxxC motif-containing protein